MKAVSKEKRVINRASWKRAHLDRESDSPQITNHSCPILRPPPLSFALRLGKHFLN